MESLKVVLEMNASELALILSALRLMEQQYDGRDRIAINNDWPDHFEGLDPIEPDGIEDLCERINCAPDQEDIVIVVEGGLIQDVFLPIPEGKDPITSLPYSLIDYDVLKDGGMESQDIVDKWNSFSPALKKYYREHCKDEYEKYFKEPIDEACTCDQESWHGPEHTTACPVEGER